MEQQELHYKPEWYAVRWSNKSSTKNRNGMLLDGATRTPLKPEWYAVGWSNKNSTKNRNGMLLDGATRTPL
jgi:hypothetical protein